MRRSVDVFVVNSERVESSPSRKFVWFQREGGIVTRVGHELAAGVALPGGALLVEDQAVEEYREDNLERRQAHVLSLYTLVFPPRGSYPPPRARAGRFQTLERGSTTYMMISNLDVAGAHKDVQPDEVNSLNAPSSAGVEFIPAHMEDEKSTVIFGPRLLATPAGTRIRDGESESKELLLGPGHAGLIPGSFRYEFVSRDAKNDVARALQALRFAASQACSQSELMRPGELSRDQVEVLRRNFLRVVKQKEIADRLEDEKSEYYKNFAVFEPLVVNESLIQFLCGDDFDSPDFLENSVHLSDLPPDEGAVVRTIRLKAFLPKWAAP